MKVELCIAAEEFISDPYGYANSGFEDATHLSGNLITIFGWDEWVSIKIARALRGEDDDDL